MIRIIRTRKLKGLQAGAGRVPELQEQVRQLGMQRRVAELVAAEASEQAVVADARRVAIENDALVHATAVVNLTRSPERGEEIRGALALQILRQNIQAAKEHGIPEEAGAVRILDALLNDEPEAVAAAGQAARGDAQ